MVAMNLQASAAAGWCRAYVSRFLGDAPIARPTALSDWYASNARHEDRNFPADAEWLPVYWSISWEPAGHVAMLHVPTGQVWSSPVTQGAQAVGHEIFASIDAVTRAFSPTTTYLGWTEDFGGLTVYTPHPTIAAGTTIQTGDEEMTIVTQETTGHVYMGDPTGITHIVHEDVTKVLNYLGLKGGVVAGTAINKLSDDDLRRWCESLGFQWQDLLNLVPGQRLVRGVDRSGVFYATVHAGDIQW